MNSLYALLPTLQPSWWKEFVLFVNNIVLSMFSFARSLTTIGLLFIALGFWLIVMGIWIRQFSKQIVRFYWGIVVVYFVVGGWIIF